MQRQASRHTGVGARLAWASRREPEPSDAPYGEDFDDEDDGSDDNAVSPVGRLDSAVSQRLRVGGRAAPAQPPRGVSGVLPGAANRVQE